MKNICPKCGSREFDISAHVSSTACVEFFEDSDHMVHDEVQHGVEWDDNDTAICRNCKHQAPLGQMVMP